MSTLKNQTCSNNTKIIVLCFVDLVTCILPMYMLDLHLLVFVIRISMSIDNNESTI